MNVWTLKLHAKMIQIKPLRNAIDRVWAVCLTVGSAVRYLKEIRRNRRMGMTLTQACERAYRWEIQRIDEMIQRIRNATFLAKHRLAQIKKEIE